MHDPAMEGDLKYRLLGIHSSRMDMGTRDRAEDESLGLNTAWYADILMTLTQRRAAGAATPAPSDAPEAVSEPIPTVNTAAD